MIENSYVMVKPEFADIPEVIAEVKKRLQSAGMKIVEEQFVNYAIEDARQHYSSYVNESWYPPLEAYITGGKAYGMVVQGENAISTIRALTGATKNPAPGTIRYDIPTALGLEIRVRENVIHSSDSPEAAKKESDIFRNICSKNNSPEL